MTTRFPEREACGWCGLRAATTTVASTPTCRECQDGGKRFRVEQSLKRWARARDAKKGKGAA